MEKPYMNLKKGARFGFGVIAALACAIWLLSMHDLAVKKINEK